MAPKASPQGSGGGGASTTGYQFVGEEIGAPITIDLPDLDMTAVAAVKVKIVTKSDSTATDFFVRFNGINSTVYHYTGLVMTDLAPTPEKQDEITVGVKLMPNLIVEAGQALLMDFEFTVDNVVGNNRGLLLGKSTSEDGGGWTFVGSIDDDISTLSNISVTTTGGGTLDEDSTIQVWQLKK